MPHTLDVRKDGYGSGNQTKNQCFPAFPGLSKQRIFNNLNLFNPCNVVCHYCGSGVPVSWPRLRSDQQLNFYHRPVSEGKPHSIIPARLVRLAAGAQLLGPHQVKAAPVPSHAVLPCPAQPGSTSPTTPHLPSAVDPWCLLSSLELSTNLHDVLQCPDIGPSLF